MFAFFSDFDFSISVPVGKTIWFGYSEAEKVKLVAFQPV